MNYRLILLLIFITNICAQITKPLPYSSYHFLQFGYFLFKNKEYARAATELERFLFIQNKDTFPRVHFKIGTAYYRLKAYQRARIHFKKALSLSNSLSLKDSSKLALAAIILRIQKKPNLYPLLPSPDSLKWDNMGLHFRFYHALAALKKEEFQKALLLLPPDSIKVARNLQYGFQKIQNLAHKGIQIRKKSPITAALLSAIVPGTGKIYTGNTGDGLYSLFIVMGSTFLSYRGIQRKDNFQTYFFGAAALFFYTGNIYGSYLSAKLFNKHTRNRLHEEIQQEINNWTHF